MSNYKLWLENLEESHVFIYVLEKGENRPETGFFMTKKRYEYRGNFYFTTPIYHVWVDGKCIATTMNYVDGIDTYRKATEIGA